MEQPPVKPMQAPTKPKPQKTTKITIDEETIDNILLNLDIIAQLEEYDKLKSNDPLLKIDKNHFLQPISRWINNEDRNNTVARINEILTTTFVFVNLITNKRSNSHLLQRILVKLINANKGLYNLKITYNSDPLIKSQLDLIMEKIEIKINEITRSLEIKTANYNQVNRKK